MINAPAHKLLTMARNASGRALHVREGLAPTNVHRVHAARSACTSMIRSCKRKIVEIECSTYLPENREAREDLADLNSALCHLDIAARFWAEYDC